MREQEEVAAGVEAAPEDTTHSQGVESTPKAAAAAAAAAAAEEEGGHEPGERTTTRHNPNLEMR